MRLSLSGASCVCGSTDWSAPEGTAIVPQWLLDGMTMASARAGTLLDIAGEGGGKLGVVACRGELDEQVEAAAASRGGCGGGGGGGGGCGGGGGGGGGGGA